MDTKLYVSGEDARSFVTAVLVGNGVAPENANIVAKCLVAADLRGVDLMSALLDLLTGPLPLAVGTLPIIWYALRLIDRITATQPFTQATATGLRRLGVVVLIAGAASEIVRNIAGYLLAATVVAGLGVSAGLSQPACTGRPALGRGRTR